jgi:alanine-glyoxylate transaminase/(R)-3-amino-2-methylpropionate-pyruvate transaminase
MEKNKWVFFTYGANPMACVAASETLSVINDDNVQEHAHNLGQYVGSSLQRIHKKHPDLTVDVRGRGLMWGIELDQKFAAGIYETMKDHHVLVGLGGQQKNVLRVMPPMCLNQTDIDNFVDVLDNVMSTYNA